MKLPSAINLSWLYARSKRGRTTFKKWTTLPGLGPSFLISAVYQEAYKDALKHQRWLATKDPRLKALHDEVKEAGL